MKGSLVIAAMAAVGWALPAFSAQQPIAPRTVLSLDGRWQIAEGGRDHPPKEFGHSVSVPGLVDMALPAFESVGKPDKRREAFWYRRTFRLAGPVPEVALLKVHKARYGTRVILNGKPCGEHLPCFTPGYFDLRGALRGEGQENELLVCVGADRQRLPAGMPTGWDFEKYLYIPGIYDSVELIATGTPYLVNFQAVPQVEKEAVRVVAELEAVGKAGDAAVRVEVAEAKSGRVVASAQAPALALESGQRRSLDLTLPLPGCHLWSPGDPFLYELRLTTARDGVRQRFGMRSFRFDPISKRALLNGKPYYLRGSNICAYRFFEDAQRADRPWRAEWVRRLHQKLKTMHWNALRYCIGFPPELWYDIADEEGFLIQDEFPIWLLGKAPEDPKAEKIIPEYTEWMRERWNHPCVVIWDAQNESFTDQTGRALRAVRGLDLSNRPWENGWSEPQDPADCVEAHPYLFIRGWSGQKPFRFEEIAQVSGTPHLQERQKKLAVPILINEYGWLWLNRDGTPTCLTDKVYESLLGPNSTTPQRRSLYARYLAAKTEFWRCHRQCAGVLHFCALGYSRPGIKPRPEGGATSDHFSDLEHLTFEPLFEEYLREAFNPLGVMLDLWVESAPPSSKREVKVYVINDRPAGWRGDVRLRILRDGKEISSESRAYEVSGLGRQIQTLTLRFPSEPGRYTVSAELDDGGTTIRSRREVSVKK